MGSGASNAAARLVTPAQPAAGFVGTQVDAGKMCFGFLGKRGSLECHRVCAFQGTQLCP